MLLRHAQALPAEGGSDIERALSPKGLSDAHALGQSLKTRKFTPARIACSSAKRTQQTCAEVLKGLGEDVHTEYIKAIYNARFGDLISIVQGMDDKLSSLLIIGHNPTIYEMAMRMALRGPDSLLNHLSQGYAPATLSVFEADIERWAQINPDRCVIKAVLDPLDYNAPATPARWT